MDEQQKHIIIHREVTREQLATELYHITDTITDTAEAMANTPQDADAAALLVDIAGWADRIKTLAEMARDNAYQLMG